jgi:hypothetical protein
MVSFVGNPTLKFFNTVWWLSIELLTKSRKSAFLGKEISFNEILSHDFPSFRLLFAAQKKHSPSRAFNKKAQILLHQT